MTKCPVCNSRKGKRKCMREEGLVCSQCCGLTREVGLCQGCGFYPENGPVRRYGEVPRFSTQEMESDFQLQSYSNTIEGTLCLLDQSNRMSLNDAIALKIIEMLLDRHHYRDSDVSCDDGLAQAGFDLVSNAIAEDLTDVSEEVIVKVLGVIRYVAGRRTRGGRQYFDIIQQYVGSRVGSGVRLLPNCR